MKTLFLILALALTAAAQLVPAGHTRVDYHLQDSSGATAVGIENCVVTFTERVDVNDHRPNVGVGYVNAWGNGTIDLAIAAFPAQVYYDVQGSCNPRRLVVTFDTFLIATRELQYQQINVIYGY